MKLETRNGIVLCETCETIDRIFRFVATRDLELLWSILVYYWASRTLLKNAGKITWTFGSSFEIIDFQCKSTACESFEFSFKENSEKAAV